MINKRMFSIVLMDSDAMLELPHETQLAYYRLLGHTDDDGFVIAPRRVLRMAGISEEVLTQLVRKKLIIRVRTDLYLIRHWHTQNTIPKDYYTPSPHAKLLKKYEINKNGEYQKPKKKEEKKYDGLTLEELVREGSFEIKVASYFMKNSYLSSPDSFIAYNVGRGWAGHGGESVKENWERYADEWERGYHLRHGLPIAGRYE